MGKKKHGHYCFGCDRYRANEKFSGKGHRQHICKECKSKGKGKENFLDVKPHHNRFIKLLKVKCVVFKEENEYLFFSIRGQTYLITNLEDQPLYALNFIYKFNKKSSPILALTGELNDHPDDVFEALMMKTENKYQHAICIEDEEYMVNDMYGYKPTDKEYQYLRLITKIEAIISKRMKEEENHLLNIMFSYL
ncbi:hypothetical protein [Bacillus sp. AFS040349]|uniref:hypothetical protein n=1 Tax=Bacillus sp. AFS040349 TaxID=2033502 RepID=UPI000BFBD92E|nr:hypothetical protein [Bacillus sp. AFS040349]PGT80939.1 hypothetical protein COD11_19295 [Bacillus sp. AFS040349]